MTRTADVLFASTFLTPTQNRRTSGYVCNAHSLRDSAMLCKLETKGHNLEPKTVLITWCRSHTALDTSPPLQLQKGGPTCYNPQAMLQFLDNTKGGRVSTEFLRCALTSEVKRAACNLCVCRSPCHDSPSLVHLVKRAEAGPPCCHKGLRAYSHASFALSRPPLHATEALGALSPPPRLQTEQCKVGWWDPAWVK